MVAQPSNVNDLSAEAWRIYNARLKPRLEPRENGKFLVLNLDTGEYELDADDLAASRRAEQRFGNARLATIRVGHHAAYRMGSATRGA